MSTHLESDILRIAQASISEAIVKNLTGYNGPLAKLCEQVMANNNAAMLTLVNGEVASLLSRESFRVALKEELNAKLARCLLKRIGGEIEKRVNELKANPETRAKITLAIQEAVK